MQSNLNIGKMDIIFLKDVLNFCLKKFSGTKVFLLYHIVVLIYKKD